MICRFSARVLVLWDLWLSWTPDNITESHSHKDELAPARWDVSPVSNPFFSPFLCLKTVPKCRRCNYFFGTAPSKGIFVNMIYFLSGLWKWQPCGGGTAVIYRRVFFSSDHHCMALSEQAAKGQPLDSITRPVLYGGYVSLGPKPCEHVYHL